MFKLVSLIVAGVGFVVVEGFKLAGEFQQAAGGMNLEDAKVVVDMIQDQYLVLDVNQDYLVFQEMTNGTYELVEEFDTRVEVVRYINDIKVTMRGH
ncbi:hypothetical protein IMZ31_19630 (plasmid) [Pontibacillus sp. ALD_SL1]|uniref:hypothetical protein n=1 Tax=Pontibacillus sp. ALD_SL1 TaxID=2777185 RepID=UPI001A95BB18|nr:hypothetical protein [Pontibacillus sp. ALD_SL1]QST02763.1 hypothetical protein IMZ31_19630 [Pontibacillus sp. ALD_SL1]